MFFFTGTTLRDAGECCGHPARDEKTGARQGEADADVPVPHWARTGMLQLSVYPLRFLPHGLNTSINTSIVC